MWLAGQRKRLGTQCGSLVNSKVEAKCRWLVISKGVAQTAARLANLYNGENEQELIPYGVNLNFYKNFRVESKK